MYPSDLILFIISYLVLILFSAGLNMAEAALFAVPELTLKRLAGDSRHSAKRVTALRQKPYLLLNTIIMANMLAVVAAAHLAEMVCSQLLGNAGIWVAVGISSTLVLVIGSIVPKTYGLAFPTQTSLNLSAPLLFLRRLLFPLVFLFSKLGETIIALLRSIFPPERERTTVEDILTEVEIAHRDGSVDDRERDMINRVLDLSQTRVSEIMVPRMQMLVLSRDMPIDEARQKVRLRGFSHVPIYDREPENIIGVVSSHRLLLSRINGDTGKSLADIAVPPHFIPETKPASKLMQEMWTWHHDVCIVTDEYGFVTGLITREDLLEEVIGEIGTRQKPDKYHIKKVDENCIISRGFVEREVASKLLGVSLEDSNSETVAGFLLNHIHRIPSVGEKFEFGNVRFEVLEADEKHIITLRITRMGEAEAIR